MNGGRETQHSGLRTQDSRRSPGFIFDLDGTLADTLDDIAASLNHALARVALPAVPRERVRTMIGEGLPVLLARAAQSSDPDLIQRLLPIYRSHYRVHALDQTTLYDGMPEALDALTQRGCPLAVLSNKPHDFTTDMCRVLLARWKFVAMDGFRDGGPRKPDPAAAVALAQRLERDCRDVLFVGDSAVDVRTALGAGMTPIGVSWGFREREELTAAGVSRIIDHPSELLFLTDEP